MEGSEDVAWLICTPGDLANHVPAQMRACGRCPGSVWVSLPMVPEVDAGNVRAVCTRCALKVPRDDVQFAISPHQVEQLKAMGIYDRSAAFIDRLNRSTPRRWRARRDKGRLGDNPLLRKFLSGDE